MQLLLSLVQSITFMTQVCIRVEAFSYHHFHTTLRQACSGTTGKDVDVKSSVQGEGIQGLSTDFQIIKADRN
jgi:hypothetical protein